MRGHARCSSHPHACAAPGNSPCSATEHSRSTECTECTAWEPLLPADRQPFLSLLCRLWSLGHSYNKVASSQAAWHVAIYKLAAVLACCINGLTLVVLSCGVLSYIAGPSQQSCWHCLQVCWANFGSQGSVATGSSSAGHKLASSSSAGHAAGRRSSFGLEGRLHQRTSSLSTWLPGQPAPAATATPASTVTPATAGTAGTTPAGVQGSIDPDATPLPAWWGAGGSGQTARGARPAVPQTPATDSAAGAYSTPAATAAAQATINDAKQQQQGGDTALEAGAAGGAQQSLSQGSGRTPSSGVGRASGHASVSGAVLCMLHKASITCVFPSGELLECPLLQPCQTLWPLPTGVILSVSIAAGLLHFFCSPNLHGLPHSRGMFRAF